MFRNYPTGSPDDHHSCRIESQALKDPDIPEGQPQDQRSSQAEGSPPHIKALPAPAAVWPSWSSPWPTADQQHPPTGSHLINRRPDHLQDKPLNLASSSSRNYRNPNLKPLVILHMKNYIDDCIRFI